MSKTSSLVFEILLDDLFDSINVDKSICPSKNKYILSIINGFEDESWMYHKFQNFVWDNIAETALSHEEREKLANKSHSLLTSAAKSLRLTDKSDIGGGSELAEVVLYGIMKHHYHALPVVPKIFYKQNSQDNAKGADSVHIVIHDDDFSIWLGEAKFYNSIEDSRLDGIVKSVGNSLATRKLRKENSIITSIHDLDKYITNNDMKVHIKKCLGIETSIDVLKPHLHIPILLLHECNTTKSCKSLTEEYKLTIIKHHKERSVAYFRKQVAALGSVVTRYSDINFHVILFPVPDKKEIVNKFLDNVRHYKEQ